MPLFDFAQIFRHVEAIFPMLLQTLSDPSDEVVLLDLEVLAEVSSSAAGCKQFALEGQGVNCGDTLGSASGLNGYFGKFMVSLLDIFSSDGQLLEERGSFIIRYVCPQCPLSLCFRPVAFYFCFLGGSLHLLLHKAMTPTAETTAGPMWVVSLQEIRKPTLNLGE